MKHWLFNIAVLLSILLCAASIAGWVRSRWVGEQFHFRWHRQSNGVTTAITFGFRHSGGDFGFYRVQSTFPAVNGGWFHWPGGTSPLRRPPSMPVFCLLGYGWYSDEVFSSISAPRLSATENVIVLPYWLLTLLTAILPTWWLLFSRHLRAARRIKRGQCPICGYDLRASPDRCPECGTSAARS